MHIQAKTQIIFYGLHETLLAVPSGFTDVLLEDVWQHQGKGLISEFVLLSNIPFYFVLYYFLLSFFFYFLCTAITVRTEDIYFLVSLQLFEEIYFVKCLHHFHVFFSLRFIDKLYILAETTGYIKAAFGQGSLKNQNSSFACGAITDGYYRVTVQSAVYKDVEIPEGTHVAAIEKVAAGGTVFYIARFHFFIIQIVLSN